MLRRKSILVVERNPNLTCSLQATMAPEEWSIDRVADGKCALERVAAIPIAVVVGDTECLSSGGARFVRRLRRAGHSVPVILVASNSNPAGVIASIRAHAFAHMTKPCDPEVLAQMVSEAGNNPEWTDGIELVSGPGPCCMFRVRCSLVGAARLEHFLQELQSDLPGGEREGMGVAFREMLLNAMEHGGHFDPHLTVDVFYLRTQHSLICCIRDPGRGFSLDNLPHAAVSNPSDMPSQHMEYRMKTGMRAGGFGIQVARNLVDGLFYNKLGNQVVLVKHRAQPGYPDAGCTRDVYSHRYSQPNSPVGGMGANACSA